MKNKYIRFILTNRKIRREALLILIGLCVILAEGYVIKNQTKNLQKFFAEKKLVEQVPQFEQFLNSGKKSFTLAQVTAKGIKNYQLTGIGSLDREFYAVINNKVHRIGDTIEEYTITAIEPSEVVLRNKYDNNSVSLTLYSDEESGAGMEKPTVIP